MRWWALAAGLALVGVSCGGAAGDADERGLRVLAAASLSEAFAAMGTAFEAANEGVDVDFVFAGSPSLVRQLQDGAPADVLVTADVESMDVASDASLVTGPTIVARNRLALVVPDGNPAGIRDLADLGRARVTYVACAPDVPCGRRAAAALAAAGVTARPASLEQDVTAVLAKVTLGEADAGIVYATDAASARDRVETVAVDLAGGDAVYPAAVTSATGHDDLAQAFVEFLAGADGRRVFDRFGFLSP